MFRHTTFRVSLLALLIALIVDEGLAEPAATSKQIFHLKKGHLDTCLPNIANQLKSMGLEVARSNVQLYCECLGNFYFNDLTRSEFSEIEKSQGALPKRIEKQQRAIQEYCVDQHIN